MVKRTSQFLSGPGFTLIELLVVIGIITLLLGFLATGMQAFRRRANDLRQKSHFHAIEVGLELFYKDYDDYPDSWVLPDPDDDPMPSYIWGAQHLAEALLGRDLRGFDPHSSWCALVEKAANDTEIYARDEKGSTQSEIKASEARRWGPYIELKKDMNVLVMELLYGVGNCGDVYPSSENPADSGKRPYRSPVFVDIFRQKRVTLDNGDSVRVGTPVLYYKAKTSSRLFRKEDDSETDINEADHRKWIYNYEDNRGIIELGTVNDPTVKHLFDENHPEPDETKKGVYLFYETITNPKVSRIDKVNLEKSDYKPFNAKMFILVSAGRDGIFGTRDDITNFDY